MTMYMKRAVVMGVLTSAAFFGLVMRASAADRQWSADEKAEPQAAQAGSASLEPSTLRSIGLLWPVMGDSDGDASISVDYRMDQETSWREGMDLFWIHPERQPEVNRVPNGRLFAGSLVDLQPGTHYKVRLTLRDPDGGSTTVTLDARTKPWPQVTSHLRERRVVPVESATEELSSTGQGEAIGLRQALQTARPGDLLLLQPGRYRAADLVVRTSGRVDRPIVIRGARPGVVLDGAGADTLLDVSETSHVWLENITFENARALIRADGAQDLVVRKNTFRVALRRDATGIESFDADSSGFLVSDNKFLGPNEDWPMTTRNKTLKERVNGITIAGSGHDIAYNRIVGVGDGINTGRIVEHNAPHQGLSATDIYRNDIDLARTECIEADHALTNVRIYENRLTNCLYGVSAQPARGGPVYIFRNRIFNTSGGPFKLHNHTSGVLLLQNTSVRHGVPFNIQPARETVNDVISRNNLFIGTESPALRSTGRMRRCDFDNDGYAFGLGGTFMLWNQKGYASPRQAAQAGVAYDRHGAHMLFSGRVFANGPRPPTSSAKPLSPELNKPELSADSRAIDKAVRLPNFNDGFEGMAPDLGCCEHGTQLPSVGPRTSSE